MTIQNDKYVSVSNAMLSFNIIIDYVSSQIVIGSVSAIV